MEIELKNGNIVRIGEDSECVGYLDSGFHAFERGKEVEESHTQNNEIKFSEKGTLMYGME